MISEVKHYAEVSKIQTALPTLRMPVFLIVVLNKMVKNLNSWTKATQHTSVSCDIYFWFFPYHQLSHAYYTNENHQNLFLEILQETAIFETLCNPCKRKQSKAARSTTDIPLTHVSKGAFGSNDCNETVRDCKPHENPFTVF